MSKSAKSNEGKKGASTGQLWLRLPGLIREALYETVIGAGLACVDEVWKPSAWLYVESVTRIWWIARHRVRATSPVRWCWEEGESR